jgi:hypothetical protein
MPSIEPGSKVEPRALIIPIIDMTGSFGRILGMRKTTVMPSQTTKTYWIRRGMRYRFTNVMTLPSRVFNSSEQTICAAGETSKESGRIGLPGQGSPSREIWNLMVQVNPETP